MRLIDADALIELITSHDDITLDRFGELAVIRMIKEQPTVCDTRKSDLISRQALLELFVNLRVEHETTSISYNALYELILRQPTAYDAEKVVEDIKSLIGYEIYKNTFDLIIDIVRKGGVE